MDHVITPEPLLDARQKLFLMANSQRLAGGVPALIINSPNQHRKLRPKLGNLADRKSVPQSVQYRAQSIVSPLFVLPAQALHQFLKPEIGLLNCRIKNA